MLVALVLALTLIAGAAAPLAAQEPAPSATRPAPKVRILLGGGIALGSVDYTDSRRFPVYEEEAGFEARYSSDSAPGLDAGIELRFGGRLGAQLAFSRYNRDGEVSFSGSIPHPFFFDQDRELSGTLGSLGYTESALHLDLVFVAARSDRVDVSFFGGVSLVKVEAELIAEIDLDQSYPFDEVQLAGTPTTKVSDNPVGFNLGASLDWRLSDHFGLGALGRFTLANASLEPIAGSSVEVDAASFAVTAGVRLYF